MLAEVGHGVEVEIERLTAKRFSPLSCACHRASRRETFCGVMREEYSDRKLFLGMALSPQNSASPSSATSAMTWLLRSIDHSLSASEARRARQGRKALLGENLAHRGCAQRRALLLESLADLVDRVIPLPQRHDLLAGTALLGLLARPGASCCEEFWQLAAAKGVAQHTECARRVAEALCRLRRRQFLHEEGAQSLILALARRRRLLEEAATVR